MGFVELWSEVEGSQSLLNILVLGGFAGKISKYFVVKRLDRDLARAGKTSGDPATRSKRPAHTHVG